MFSQFLFLLFWVIVLSARACVRYVTTRVYTCAHRQVRNFSKVKTCHFTKTCFFEPLPPPFPLTPFGPRQAGVPDETDWFDDFLSPDVAALYGSKWHPNRTLNLKWKIGRVPRLRAQYMCVCVSLCAFVSSYICV